VGCFLPKNSCAFKIEVAARLVPSKAIDACFTNILREFLHAKSLMAISTKMEKQNLKPMLNIV
jgi:hypothetical protein